jgi:hypothetical protein
MECLTDVDEFNTKTMINVSYDQIADSHLLDINNFFVKEEDPRNNTYIEKLDIIDNGTEQVLDIIRSEANHVLGKYDKILDLALEKYEELKNSKETL